MTNDVQILRLHATASALIGYTESLRPGTVITEEYVERLKSHYVPGLAGAVADIRIESTEPCADCAAYRSRINVTSNQHDSIQADLAHRNWEMRNTLRYYAEQKNYSTSAPMDESIWVDAGKKARDVLGIK